MTDQNPALDGWTELRDREAWVKFSEIVSYRGPEPPTYPAWATPTLDAYEECALVYECTLVYITAETQRAKQNAEEKKALADENERLHNRLVECEKSYDTMRLYAQDKADALHEMNRRCGYAGRVCETMGQSIFIDTPDTRPRDESGKLLDAPPPRPETNPKPRPKRPRGKPLAVLTQTPVGETDQTNETENHS